MLWVRSAVVSQEVGRWDDCGSTVAVSCCLPRSWTVELLWEYCCGARKNLRTSLILSTAATPFCSLYLPPAALANVPTRALENSTPDCFRPPCGTCCSIPFGSKAKKKDSRMTVLLFWWRRWGSNPLPLECHSSALPGELRPHRNQGCSLDFFKLHRLICFLELQIIKRSTERYYYTKTTVILSRVNYARP